MMRYGLWALLISVVWAKPPDLVVLYHIRPPGITALGEAQTLEGNAGGTATQALKLAKIPYQLSLQSPLHQLQQIKNNDSRVCALDWYHTQEREQFALLSAPLYREAPFKVIVHRDSVLKSPVSLNSLRSEYTLVRTANMSLGKAIDTMVQNGEIKAVDWHGAPAEVVSVVWRKKADFALMPADEMPVILQQQPHYKTEIRLLDTADFPAPPTVHMICSRKVGDTLIKQFNAALDQVRSLN